MPDTITTAVPQQTPPQEAILHPAQVYFLSRRLPGIVHLVQYDQTLPYLAVELFSSDEPYTVPDGAAVNIRMAKPVPSDKKVYNPAYGISEDRHTVYITVTPQMTVVAGCTNPVIEVVVDGGVACTGTLRLEIDPNPVQESDLIDTDEYKTLEEILAEAQASAQIVQDNEQALQDVHNNLSAIQNAAANAQAAAASAQDAEDAADRAAIESQKALGFRTYFGGQVVPDANGDLDPSRPMSTPTAASVTIKARGDRIAGLTMAGKTTQAGTGDPSPDNIRMIDGAGMYDRCIVLDGSEDWVDRSEVANIFSATVNTLPLVGGTTTYRIKASTAKVVPTGGIATVGNDITEKDLGCANASSTQGITFYLKRLSISVEDVKDELSHHPLIVWYRSVDFYKSTGPFYTVVELSDDPYRAVGFELNQPLFDGDSFEIGGLSGCDQMVVLDGSEDEGWAVQSIPSQGSTRRAYRTVITLLANNPIDVSYRNKVGASSYLPKETIISWDRIRDKRYFVINETNYNYVGVRYDSLTSLDSFKSYLQSHPLIVFYRSVNYTEENDIPVALEKHTKNYIIFDGTEAVAAETSGINAPYLQIADVADDPNSSHRLVSSVAPFVYAYNGAGAFAAHGNIVFGKAWCQSNGFANTETMDKDFKSFLTAQHAAGTPVQVVYELATPVSYARPVPTMIAQPGENGTFTVTGENSLSVLLKAFQDGGNAATIEGHTWADILAAIKSQLLPVGTIIEWSPVSGDSTDLSTPAKVAAYYGFGTWEAYGPGRMTLGQSASHAVGSTGGEEAHQLSRAEMPNIGGSISFHGPPNAGTPIGAVAGDFKVGSTVSGKYLPGGQQTGANSVGSINLSVGGGDAHNNMPPYITVYRWRRIA